ncbi:metal ABC transporter solute-binding protein, Zn/Mn family [Paracoccus marcusii]|uniref:metal ABC transporter solute-binding protein, Zn/Mn family n=1 Tax=Paracoccus marcusii TaxID=59779 RepID=UPI0039C85E0B
MADADLVLVNGLNLDGWAQQYLDRAGDVPIVTVTQGIDPADPQRRLRRQAEPHAWMALDSARIYVDNIAAAMAQADPDNAAAYAANADDYKQQISDVVGPLRDAARALPQDRRYLVTSEGAFSYLARDFGLTEMYLWPINAEGQGTPQQVRALIDAMRDTGAPVIFSESTISDRPARSIAAETGRTMAASSMWTACRTRTGRCPPIWTCCGLRRRLSWTRWPMADPQTQRDPWASRSAT